MHACHQVGTCAASAPPITFAARLAARARERRALIPAAVAVAFVSALGGCGVAGVGAHGLRQALVVKVGVRVGALGAGVLLRVQERVCRRRKQP